MIDIDKQRVAAVRKLEALGYRYEGDEWVASTVTNQSILAEADALLSALVLRADALEGCLEGSEEEAELADVDSARYRTWHCEYANSGQGQSGPLQVRGRWTAVYTREDGVWKMRLLTAVPIPPPKQP